MTYTLRGKQPDAAAAGVELLTSGRRKNGIIVLPTGYGKSLVIASVVLALDTPCTVFQPSKEILEQNEAKFIAYGYRPSVFSASVGRREVGDITLATIGSVKKCPEMFRDTKIIIDECDLVNAKAGMYRDFYEALGRPQMLGFTATPYRLVSERDGLILKFLTRTRPRVFDEVTYYVQNREGFEEGWLSPLVYKQWLAIDKAQLKLNTTGSDYTDESVQRHFEAVGFAGKLEKTIARVLEMGRKHVLVFCRSVSEATRLAESVEGFAVVTEKTPKRERERIAADFRSGTLKGVCNVGVWIVGFDFPELDCVILANPGNSLRRMYQMIGRGMRPHPDKPDCLIVDMVGLVTQFGKVEDLELRDSGAGKWAVWSGSRQLTNMHFGEVKDRCRACGMKIFFGHHEETKKPAMLNRPMFGRLPDIALVPVNGKTYYRVVGKDDPSAEFLRHWAVCQLMKAYNQTKETR